MIPILIVVGVVFGRWWRTTLAVSTIGWAMALAITDVVTVNLVPATMAIALLNTGFGVALHQGVRLARGHRPAQTSS